MYVITMSTGTYDDYTVNVVAVTDDLAKGQSYVDKQNQTYQSMDKKVSAFYKNEYVAWINSHRRPDGIAHGLIAIPKWKGNEKITEDMRAQRKALELKNAEIARKAHEPVVQWHKDLQQFTEDWAKAHLTEEEMEIFKIRDDNHWDIEPATWL